MNHSSNPEQNKSFHNKMFLTNKMLEITLPHIFCHLAGEIWSPVRLSNRPALTPGVTLAASGLLCTYREKYM